MLVEDIHELAEELFLVPHLDVLVDFLEGREQELLVDGATDVVQYVAAFLQVVVSEGSQERLFESP